MDNKNPSMDLTGIMEYIQVKSGIVLNRHNAHLLQSRIKKILKETQVQNIEELYYKLCVKEDPNTIVSVIDAITINETFWFRNQELWSMLENLFLPIYIDEIRKGERETIKVWSAACSYGQEPYSIAMCIDHYLSKHKIQDVTMSHFEILATDISSYALEIAALAQYDKVSMARGLNETFKLKYFKTDGNMWCLDKEIKDVVRFKKFNLVEDQYGFDTFDMIFCRNVLIYFSENKKKEIYNKLAHSLRKNGVLLIGSSELLEDDEQRFSREIHTECVYFKKTDEGGG